MPVAASWDNDDRTIIRFVFADPWDWPDLDAVVKVALELHQTVDHPVVWLYDVRHITKLPSGAFSAGRRLLQETIPHRQPYYLVLGAGPMVETIVHTFVRVFGRRHSLHVHFVEDDEEAHQLAAQWLDGVSSSSAS